MTISALTYAEGNNVGQLAASVAASIAAGNRPYGPPVMLGALLTQPMITGTDPSSVGDMQDDIDAVVAEVNALQAATGALTPITANGAITIANLANYVFTKAGVAAMTLAAPTAPQEGFEMFFTNGTANAHTITATGLIEDGVTGGSKNLITFAAFLGSGIRLKAYNLKWHVMHAVAAPVT